MLLYSLLNNKWALGYTSAGVWSMPLFYLMHRTIYANKPYCHVSDKTVRKIILATHWTPLTTRFCSACHFISPLHNLLSWFSVPLTARSRSAVWDTFQISLSLSYQPVPAARLVFTLSRAPPCYHGDAAVTCQFHGGDARRPVMAQNRIVGEFDWKWESQHRVSERMNSWALKNLNYMGMWQMCARRLQGAAHGSDWLLLQRETGADCVGKASCLSLTQGNKFILCVCSFRGCGEL